LSFLLLLLFFYYLVRDGARLKRKVMVLSPLSDAHELEIIARLSRAISSTVRGSLVLALLQGLVSGIGFTLFGVPNPVLWGSVVVIAAFVPTIGTALVQIPAILYLFASGHPTSALALIAWAAVAVGMLDNLLGPRLMAKGTHLHPLVMMVAVLGGITVFGPMGFLVGPILMALLFALFDIYLSLVRGPHMEEQ
jgi:predicted PurR-regulated permease PerM